MSNLRDAQDAPGNGPGDGQSAAGAPPSGSQTTFRKFAAEAGDPRQDNLEASRVLDVDG